MLFLFNQKKKRGEISEISIILKVNGIEEPFLF